MTRVDLLLVILGEEACEVAQETSKCLRFGVDNVYTPIGKSNRERVMDELCDLWAVVEMLQEEGALPKGLSPDAIRYKKEKVEKLLLYSRECGRLEP